MSRPQVQVKKYKKEKEFEKDANRMIRDGYHIEGQSTRTKKYSLMTGFFTNGLTPGDWST